MREKRGPLRYLDHRFFSRGKMEAFFNIFHVWTKFPLRLVTLRRYLLLLTLDKLRRAPYTIAQETGGSEGGKIPQINNGSGDDELACVLP